MMMMIVMNRLIDRGVAFSNSSLFKYCRSHAEKYLSFRAVRIFFGVILYFIVGCIVYNYFEGWDTIAAFKFSFVTMSTVGYGYLIPSSDNCRIFTIFYMLFGIYFVFCTISTSLTERFDALIEYAKKTTAIETDEIGHNLNRNRLILLALVVAQILVVIIGAVIFNYLQPQWSFISSIYFAVETSTVSVVFFYNKLYILTKY